MTHQKLTSTQRDRAAGVLVGQACGDALGVPYEFGPPLRDTKPEMIGGGLGPYAPGEWSDDTQMAICIARVTAEGPLDDRALGRIMRGFQHWLDDGASDVGNQTRAVLAATRDIFTNTPPDEDGGSLDQEWFWAALDASGSYAKHHERSAGNGALMRNGIVGLTALHDRDATAENARNVARLTHADPLVLDSCVLHAEAIRHAVMTGEYDLLAGLDLIPEERRRQWTEWIETATLADPSTIEANGSTFGALRAAHAAITSMRVMKYAAHEGGHRLHVRHALEAAVGAGHDTDTVAAITGALMGAVYGVSAIPGTWRRRIHGWPDMTARDLIELALRTAGETQPSAWPLREIEPSPGGRALDVPTSFDEGLHLGTQTALAHTQADAVVSLSRIGSQENRETRLPPVRRGQPPRAARRVLDRRLRRSEHAQRPRGSAERRRRHRRRASGGGTHRLPALRARPPPNALRRAALRRGALRPDGGRRGRADPRHPRRRPHRRAAVEHGDAHGAAHHRQPQAVEAEGLVRQRARHCRRPRLRPLHGHAGPR